MSTEDRLNPTKAYTEYKQIWDELNRQFGGDPDYTRHVIRSPMYIQGWHRKNPLQRGSSTHINTNTTPPWHHVKWYPPRAYSLAELRELIVFLQKLHGENTELEQLPSNIEPEGLSHEPEECSPEIPDTNEDDDDSSPNCWLFNQTRIRCYPVAKKYRDNRDGFLTYAVGIAYKLNAQLHEPVSDRELAGICRSIVDWCLSAKFASDTTSIAD